MGKRRYTHMKQYETIIDTVTMKVKKVFPRAVIKKSPLSKSEFAFIKGT